MPPNLRRKLQFYAAAAKRVFAIAEAKNVSFFVLFLADSNSVFGNRQDHDKHETFARLSTVRAIAPYLADTVLLSSHMPLSNRNVAPAIPFPIIIKPIRGAQSIGVVGIRDEATLWRFLRKRRSDYIAQHLISNEVEIGVSFTRNPAEPADFFGVAHKVPVNSIKEWKNGFWPVPKSFYHYDVTTSVDRKRFIELCIIIAESLGTKSLRFDAFISKEGDTFRFDTLQIIDVNTGPFAIDEFLFDVRHSPQFVVANLTRKYAYLLLWGAQYSPRPELSLIWKLVLHYLYCYIVTLFGHISEMPAMCKLRDATSRLPKLKDGKNRRL